MIRRLPTCQYDPRPGARAGFTLLEVLVAVAILAMLAGLAAAAIYNAQEAARRARTRALIVRLDSMMARRWESYRTRRLPLTMDQRIETGQQFAQRQLWARRELMRMELPDTYQDLFMVPQFHGTVRFDSAMNQGVFFPLMPALVSAYSRRILAQYPASTTLNDAVMVGAAGHPPLVDRNESAECLYLILTTGPDSIDGGAPPFSARDIGDTDGDGMPEFIDGWGNPIKWLRWPSGFYSQLMAAHDPVVDRDPFDPLGVDSTPGNVWTTSIKNGAYSIGGGGTVTPVWVSISYSFTPPPSDPVNTGQFYKRGYRVYPLIMSAGPDGTGGMQDLSLRINPYNIQLNHDQTQPDNSPVYSDPYYPFDCEQESGGMIKKQAGAPLLPDDKAADQFGGSADDNIHNHLPDLTR